MHQPKLFGPDSLNKVVNVASVKHRSPFRYPGGKTWLIPRIRYWLMSMEDTPKHFVEPFVGGGIVSLTVAAEELADHVTMIELDHEVASVWITIIEDDGGGEWLAQQILEFDITRENVVEILECDVSSTWDLAFRTIVKNRVHHGGILAPGSAMTKNGENGKGVASRWYPETLARRIRKIVLFRDKLTFIEGDALSYMESHLDGPQTTYFIDPPYTAGSKKAGRRLYTHSELDHEKLFDLAASLKGAFLMTYSNDESVIRMAEERRFCTAPVAMRNTHHAKMSELLVSSDLSWLP